MRFRRKAAAGVTLLVLLAGLLLLLSASSQNAAVSPEDSRLEQQLLDLQDRLRKAENLNRQRENEMYALLTRVDSGGNLTALLNNVVTSLNLSTMEVIRESLQMPGIYSYLPHLTGHPEYLTPAIKLSKGRQGVSVVIGVPTIKRAKESYLIKTLSSLVSGLSQEESADCLIVVFIGEPWDKQYVENTVTSIRDNFSPYLESGLLDVIVPPVGFYPNLDLLKENFGDTKERVKCPALAAIDQHWDHTGVEDSEFHAGAEGVAFPNVKKWRTKQNLDYAFHMLYGRPKATYYVQLEDDVVAKPGYLTVMKKFAREQKDEWIMLEFSVLGFIGKLFKSSDVSTIVEFFLMFHADKPIDWLMDHLLWVKVCSPEKDVKHCQRMIQAVRRRYKPSLFQHIGMESSLKGKVQKLKDRDFGKTGLYRAHANPPAELSTTLKTYQNYLLSKAYAGENFFWGSNPSVGDTVDFEFNPPIRIDMYLFRSGHMDHPGDVFHNTTVEVQTTDPVSQPIKDSIALKAGLSHKEIFNASANFIPIGRFNDAGVAQGQVPDGVGTVQVLRLHVHENSDAWVTLSEIMIQEKKTR